MSCVLCGSEDVRRLQNIASRDIAALYARFLQLEVMPLFSAQQVESLGYHHCARCGLLYFTPPVTGDEAFYNALQRYDWYYAEEKDEFASAARWVRPEDAVLEIGCGKGAFSHLVRCASYEGIDLSEGAVCMARAAGVCVSRATIEEFCRSREGAFNVVCAFQTLEHIPFPGAFLQAAVSCLAHGGRLILSVPSQSSFVGATCNAVLNLPPHHATRWTDEALHSIARLHGLTLCSLDHLALEEGHREWYAMTRILSWLRLLPGFNRHAAVDNSPRFWRLYNLARFLARRGATRLFAGPGVVPAGHTVLAVFEKRES